MEFGLISQSQSPSFGFAKLAHSMFGGYEYTSNVVPLYKLKDFIEQTDYKGVNIAEPYKEAVLPFCHELAASARQMGCVNTIIKDNSGRVVGYNTDYNAMLYMINRSGLRLKGKKVLIYGDSGNGRAAAAAAKYFDAGEIVHLSKKGPNSYSLVRENTDAQIIVHSTYVGMYPNNGHTLINLDLFPSCDGVVETVYNPIRSELYLAARGRGIPITDPVSMLAAKTKYASELFVGRMVADERIRQVARKIKREMSNIVLIGMPGSGKSAVGKYLSQKLGRGFLDVDTVIEQRSGVPVNRIIEKEGESAFRNLESKVIGTVGKQSGKIISVGAGAVLAECNYTHLKQNGIIIFLERNSARLGVGGRYGGGNNHKTEQLYAQRLPRFLHFADCTVENNGTIQQAGERVLEAFLTNADEY